jgi:hypothetical protein
MISAAPPVIGARSLNPVLVYQASHVSGRLGIEISSVVVQARWPSLDRVAAFINFDGETYVHAEQLADYTRDAIQREMETARASVEGTEAEIREAVEALSRQVAFDDAIPWRESPLHGESLAGLLTKAGAVGSTGFGALLGSFAGHGALLLVTVPAGIILVGAATGVAMAMRDGLYQRILALLDPESQEPPR